jgi:hypothetical protein
MATERSVPFVLKFDGDKKGFCLFDMLFCSFLQDHLKWLAMPSHIARPYFAAAQGVWGGR